MSEQQHPKEHCGHECVCWFAHGGMKPDCVFEHLCCIPCKHDTRSRPHPAPQAPEGYTGVCAVQDKCMEYSDFIESIEEELTEEDMDPPCPIKCDKRVNPNAERDAAIARKAREDVLDEIAMHGNYLSINALSHKDWNHEMRKYIQSLRQQQGGQEQPR